MPLAWCWLRNSSQKENLPWLKVLPPLASTPRHCCQFLAPDYTNLHFRSFLPSSTGAAVAIPVVDPERYDEQLAAKRDRLETQFARFSVPELEVYPSPPSHYRQ